MTESGFDGARNELPPRLSCRTKGGSVASGCSCSQNSGGLKRGSTDRDRGVVLPSDSDAVLARLKLGNAGQSVVKK